MSHIFRFISIIAMLCCFFSFPSPVWSSCSIFSVVENPDAAPSRIGFRARVRGLFEDHGLLRAKDLPVAFTKDTRMVPLLALVSEFRNWTRESKGVWIASRMISDLPTGLRVNLINGQLSFWFWGATDTSSYRSLLQRVASATIGTRQAISTFELPSTRIVSSAGGVVVEHLPFSASTNQFVRSLILYAESFNVETFRNLLINADDYAVFVRWYRKNVENFTEISEFGEGVAALIPARKRDEAVRRKTKTDLSARTKFIKNRQKEWIMKIVFNRVNFTDKRDTRVPELTVFEAENIEAGSLWGQAIQNVYRSGSQKNRVVLNWILGKSQKEKAMEALSLSEQTLGQERRRVLDLLMEEYVFAWGSSFRVDSAILNIARVDEFSTLTISLDKRKALTYILTLEGYHGHILREYFFGNESLSEIAEGINITAEDCARYKKQALDWMKSSRGF